VKPSEFWAKIFALPEQARQAESEAEELRIRADALCRWARLAISVHRSAIDDADVGGIEEGKKHVDSLPPYPDAAIVDSFPELLRQSQGPSPLPERTRRQRSDAGKPRVRKTDESAPANPAVVKAEDAARVKLAGLIRQALDGHQRSSPEPVTMTWLMACTGLDEDDIRSGIGLLSLVSWRMQREGDSQPVEVWGNYRQFAAAVHSHVEAHGFDEIIPIDSVAIALGARPNDVRIALGASRA
jgi:hypothetical protein